MANLKAGRMYLCELFDALKETKSAQKKHRVDLLREYTTKGADHLQTLKGFAECMYHPKVVFDLPPGKPPFNVNEAPDPTFTSFSLFNFFKQRYVLYFAENPKKLQNDLKREGLFLQNLEQLYKDEAILLLAMKDKDDSKLKYVNEDLFREAFPDWLPPKTEAAES